MEEIELVLTNNICFALIKLIFRFADINNNMIIIVKYLWRRVLDEKINE